jgi:CRP-like cAMP-binding protein
MEMLPLFRSMKVYTKDILYHQEDQSEELFFIVTGEVKFYVKLNIEG